MRRGERVAWRFSAHRGHLSALVVDHDAEVVEVILQYGAYLSALAVMAARHFDSPAKTLHV